MKRLGKGWGRGRGVGGGLEIRMEKVTNEEKEEECMEE